MFRRQFVAFAIGSFVSVSCWGDDAAPSPSPRAVDVEAADVRGRPQQELVKVTNARYFVWFDGRGWHLRTAAKGLTKFSGSVKLVNGSFVRLRPIGLDPKAKNPDRWGINADRTEIRFELKTAGSFDGFDFDVRRSGVDAKVAFQLKLGMNDLSRPKRIFLGRDSKNPSGAHFECPADPAAAKLPHEEAQERSPDR